MEVMIQIKTQDDQWKSTVILIMFWLAMNPYTAYCQRTLCLQTPYRSQVHLQTTRYLLEEGNAQWFEDPQCQQCQQEGSQGPDRRALVGGLNMVVHVFSAACC